MEEKEIELEEKAEQKKEKWTDDIYINVPLSEFLKLKKKINKLQNKCEKLKKEADEQRSEKWSLHDSYVKLKADYQKVLGINEEGGDKK
jgi:predicted RNase H-like nuclease (RuvC/YqgF family)